MKAQKRIIVAPLNWGLGHATRCIPVIQALIRHGFEPVLAGDGESLELLKKEFPELASFDLPGYKIRYAKDGKGLMAQLLRDLPGNLGNIRKERGHMDKIVQREGISGIISDNRFGARSDKVPSVYVTHQLKVRAGWATSMATCFHRSIISGFDACWVPDFEDENNLAGALSRRVKQFPKLTYIGPLSRMRPSSIEKDIMLTAVLSGPEPQRELLETRLRRVFNTFPGRTMIIQGLVSDKKQIARNGNLEVVNYMLMEDLEEVLNRSEMVIARSGYSTIMDLAALGSRAYFVPTPGQPEQEYLARALKEKGIADFSKQEDLSPQKMLKGMNYPGFTNRKTPKNKLEASLFDVF